MAKRLDEVTHAKATYDRRKSVCPPLWLWKVGLTAGQEGKGTLRASKLHVHQDDLRAAAKHYLDAAAAFNTAQHGLLAEILPRALNVRIMLYGGALMCVEPAGAGGGTAERGGGINAGSG